MSRPLSPASRSPRGPLRSLLDLVELAPRRLQEGPGVESIGPRRCQVMSTLRHFQGTWKKLADHADEEDLVTIQNFPKAIAYQLIHAPGAWSNAKEFVGEFKKLHNASPQTFRRDGWVEALITVADYDLGCAKEEPDLRCLNARGLLEMRESLCYK
eukprot:7501845-Pyramimonas_sp.AAC.1